MSIDKTWIGILAGAALPVLTSLLFFRYGYNGQLGYVNFVRQMMVIGGAGMLISVSCLPNLALFTLLINTNRMRVSRGIFMATLLYALAIVVVKFAL